MPPELDIYGLTKCRDAATIDRFIDAYVDRVKSWDRGDEELMMQRQSHVPPEIGEEGIEWGTDVFEWEPALTLSHIIERGLALPHRAFTVYLVPKLAELTKVILSFTIDDQLILGVAIDDKGAKPENEQRAKKLLHQLVEEFTCHAGLIVVDHHPPRDEMAFHAQENDGLTVFFAPFLF